ncbi:MAG: hypothetical protein EOL86_00550 [Deltaproteobacteria bacterium]|nr:hypothetical protein [Deltaproteobacteria bacterium]
MTEESTNTQIYVVDANNRPLAVMDREQVLRQGLKHRNVALVLSDARGRLVLRRRPADHPIYPGRWDIAGGGHVQAGLAAEDVARACVPASLPGLEVWHARTLGASARTGNAFVEIFLARLDSAQGSTLLHDHDYLSVDQDELDALASAHPDLFTPALITVWTEQIAFGPS